MIFNRISADQVRPLLIGAGSLIAGLLLWWAFTALSGVPSYVLPSPAAVAERATGLFASGGVQIHIAQTLAEIIQGSIIGVVIGMALAMVFFHTGWIQRILMPVIVVAQVTPKISIAPLIVLWIGLGIESKITLVALVVFYPILINMLARLDAMPSTLRDLSQITGMSPVRRAIRIELPFSLPALATGIRLGVLAGITAAVIGEFIGASAGLGYLEKQGQDNDDISLVLIALGLLSLIGVVLYGLVGLVEKSTVKRFQ